MKILDILKISWLQLKSAKLRTSITIIIVALGIFALILINTVLSSFQKSISESFVLMGANGIEIKPSEPKARNATSDNLKIKTQYKPIIEEEFLAFKSNFLMASQMAISMPNITNNAQANYNQKATDPNLRIFGIDEVFVPMMKFDLVAGYNFNITQLELAQNTCLLSEVTAKFLFNKIDEKTIGSIIKINNNNYVLQGIIKSKNIQGFLNYDNVIFIPLSTVRKNFNVSNRSCRINIKVSNPALLKMAKEEAINTFKLVRKIEPANQNDFTVESSENLLAKLIRILGYVQKVTWIIVLITLLSSGVGLMNILLVSVTERTKEIGLQKAIGATSKSILQLVLAESILLSLIGSLLGIVTGVLVGALITYVLKTAFVMPWLWLFFGLILCFFVGIVFGYYPAKKAAALNPINALRAT